MLVWAQQWSFDEGNYFFKHRRISGYADIEANDVGKPEQIVREASAHSASGGWMPPVLDIAFLELMSRRAKDVFPRNFRLCINEGHYILQLIPKAIRTARLIKSRPGPDAARKRLIDQPAIKQGVHGGVRRMNLNGAAKLFPVSDDLFESFMNISQLPIALVHRARFCN